MALQVADSASGGRVACGGLGLRFAGRCPSRALRGTGAARRAHDVVLDVRPPARAAAKPF